MFTVRTSRITKALVGAAAWLAFSAAALAGPGGTVKYIAFDVLNGTHDYQIDDDDGIGFVYVSGPNGMMTVDGSGEHNCPIAVVVKIPMADFWKSGINIIWTDCQVKKGKDKKNHIHHWKQVDPLYPKELWDKTPKATVAKPANGEQGRSNNLIKPMDDGRTLVVVSATGLQPGMPYAPVLYTTPDAWCGSQAVLPAGPIMIADANGAGEIAAEVPIPIQQVFGISLRKGAPNGPVALCAIDDDEDGDQVRDLLDDCPYTYNPDQADANADGVGDKCDCDANGNDDWNDVNNGTGRDLNGNGVVDSIEAPACYPDANGDGVLDIDDFIEFQVLFGVGCGK